MKGMNHKRSVTEKGGSNFSGRPEKREIMGEKRQERDQKS